MILFDTEKCINILKSIQYTSKINKIKHNVFKLRDSF